MEQSLRTDSRSIAIRLSRKVASEIEVMFEQARRENGLAFEERLIAHTDVPETVLPTMQARSAASCYHKGNLAALREQFLMSII